MRRRVIFFYVDRLLLILLLFTFSLSSHMTSLMDTKPLVLMLSTEEVAQEALIHKLQEISATTALVVDLIPSVQPYP